MSLKKNFGFSTILTFSNYLFPLFTFPYVSRILGVENFGMVNFVDSIVNYFILFSMLGISATGIREVARVKKDSAKLNSVFSSLIVLNTFTTLLVIIVLLLAIYFVPTLAANKELLMLGVLKLIFNLFLIEWFFKGIEDFKFITLRTIIIKVVFVVSVFIFVQDRNDFFEYYLLMVGLVVITAITNIFHSRKFVAFSFKSLQLRPLLNSFLTIGLYLILTSMYTTFNIAFLGFVAGETEVGFYSTAAQVYTISLSIFTALTGVLLPRLSALASTGNHSEIKSLVNKSYNFLVSCSIPAIILAIVFAPQIIYILAGNGFQGAILPLRIIMPLILIVGLEQILILQLLMPLQQDKKILINSAVGAIVGILLNLSLVEKYMSTGSAIVWFTSELFVLIIAQYFVYKVIGFVFSIGKIAQNIIYSLPVLGYALLLQLYLKTAAINMLLLAIIPSCLYIGFLQIRVVKNPIYVDVFKKIIKKI